MACDANFVFQIEGHNMRGLFFSGTMIVTDVSVRTVIEVDGVNHEAYTVDEIQIFAGPLASIYYCDKG